ncbi:hypothetical protein MKX08_001760 [Trichoderma sp. CBMAI-0020]|nr:hypothetical protein MKX08_001760 [Trichoderma sp. CBMAI-0020]
MWRGWRFSERYLPKAKLSAAFRRTNTVGMSHCYVRTCFKGKWPTRQDISTTLCGDLTCKGKTCAMMLICSPLNGREHKGDADRSAEQDTVE